MKALAAAASKTPPCSARLRFESAESRVVVPGVDLAQVALGVDVQLDRVEHRVGEQAAQERQREVLVRVVDAAQGRRLALVVEQVAEVVQQAGGDERVARLALLGEVRRLQRVLELGDGLAAVLLGAVAREQQLDVVEAQHARLLQRAPSSAVPSAANCDWRIRVAVSAPADSRIG